MTTLDDKYTVERGTVFMSGVQALVRLPMLQQVRDQRLSQCTAGFISGYRGSPLGSYDQLLQKADKYLQAHHIVFRPAVNEELAATALWGTQQLGFAPPDTNTYDGVFGIWYGKGPGVDRCSDVFKHANMAGTTPWGGVIAVAGDDHIAKSSTAAHQSDPIFMACGFPVFFPASVQEILDLGLHAFALSRFAGVWVGMKTIQEIVESSASVVVDPDRVHINLPTDFTPPADGLHIRWPDTALVQEERLLTQKWPAVLAYLRANRLNYNAISTPHDRFGIIASGKAYNDTRQALLDCGLDDAACNRLGIRLHKISVVWPLEELDIRDFATGLEHILVVEEKRSIIESQLREELYDWKRADDGRHPQIHGKDVLRAHADLNPALITEAIQQILKTHFANDIAIKNAIELGATPAKPACVSGGFERKPWFCSGCPHNTSTQVPEGSRAMAGIGCHFMTIWMNRNTIGFTQMGGEGVPWVGQQPFSKEKHVFANLGDGTYFHSGILAIRQSIAAGVNITYKILYNDAVAMTGGQKVGERPEGHSVSQIAHAMLAEGAIKTVVVTDEPEKYAHIQLPHGVGVHHRDELDAIQKAFRTIQGTTIIIYDQTCATEKRRRRKRGTLIEPAQRVVIHPLVCEGCGDCGVRSNCISIEPLETPLGRKRQINQSTCNKDFSCIQGFCPSFVTVQGGRLRQKDKSANHLSLSVLNQPLPDPVIAPLESVWGMVVAGVGGTGVITLGQLLGVAAHCEEKGIVTQDAAGLAQKGGATWSHILIAPTQDAIRTTRVGMGAADLVLGCDPIVTLLPETMQRIRAGRSHVALNAHGAPTAAFVSDTEWKNPAASCRDTLIQMLGADDCGVLDADSIATHQLGDSLFTNPVMLGFAWQKGWIPLQQASIFRAMELNAVAVEANKAAFIWGRRAALGLVDAADNPPLQAVPQPLGLEERIAFLTAYQNAKYADEYADFIQTVRVVDGDGDLTKAVIQNLFHLMAYKDEYEVARLHTDSAFLESLKTQFEGDFTLNYHLAPPLFAKRDNQGRLQKRRYGAWMQTAFRLPAGLRGLRGTVLDVFGYTAERREERALIQEYRAAIQALLPHFAQSTALQRDTMLTFARLPMQIRGYGHVKARNLATVRAQWKSLTDTLRTLF